MRQEMIWLDYFNPCGAFLMEGYGNNTCVSQGCRNTRCCARTAWMMAKFILEGGNLKGEKRELTNFLYTQKDQLIVKLSGETIRLAFNKIDPLVEEIAERAERIIEGVRVCMEKTISINEEFYSTCTLEQRNVMDEITRLNRLAHIPGMTVDEARELAKRIGEQLETALEMGLGNVGIIARQAIAYGKADKLPYIDPTGLLFIGNPETITPLSQR